LTRLDSDQNGVTSTFLVPNQPAQMLLSSVSTYHVEMSCVGPVISLSINNTPLIASEDTTYSSGSHWISAGILGDTSDVRLDSLVVTRR
jgi:hypothetical protein